MPAPSPSLEEEPASTRKVDKKYYEREMTRLQVELVKQQEYIRAEGLKVCLLYTSPSPRD